MIDWERIAELKEDFGDEGFDELVPVFIAEITEALERFGDTTPASEVAEICHFIKGSSANLGLSKLAELSGAYEKAARADTITDNPAKSLLDAFEKAQAALNAGL